MNKKQLRKIYSELITEHEKAVKHHEYCKDKYDAWCKDSNRSIETFESDRTAIKEQMLIAGSMCSNTGGQLWGFVLGLSIK